MAFGGGVFTAVVSRCFSDSAHSDVKSQGSSGLQRSLRWPTVVGRELGGAPVAGSFTPQ